MHRHTDSRHSKHRATHTISCQRQCDEHFSIINLLVKLLFIVQHLSSRSQHCNTWHCWCRQQIDEPKNVSRETDSVQFILVPVQFSFFFLLLNRFLTLLRVRRVVGAQFSKKFMRQKARRDRLIEKHRSEWRTLIAFCPLITFFDKLSINRCERSAAAAVQRENGRKNVHNTYEWLTVDLFVIREYNVFSSAWLLHKSPSPVQHTQH